MSEHGRTQSLARFINSRLPGYFLLFASLIMTFLFIGLGLFLNSRSFIISGLILLAGALLLLGFILWSGQSLKRRDEYQTQELLFSMSQSVPTDHIAYIDLGLRRGAIAISRNLTRGQITVIDVYNPQLMNSPSLAKARLQAPSALIDPRIDWYDSSLEILPLPDKSVSAVFIPNILSFIDQYGDQKKLLKEVFRILKANGRLLLSDRARNQKNQIRFPLLGGNIYPIEHWQTLITDSGFDIRRTETLDGLMICFRADKPSPYAGRQMAFDLEYS